MKQNDDHLWQVREITPIYIPSDAAPYPPIAVTPPVGYRLHSWQPNPFSIGTVIICWSRIEPSAAINALSQLPPALTAPIIDAVKRWVLKNYG